MSWKVRVTIIFHPLELFVIGVVQIYDLDSLDVKVVGGCSLTILPSEPKIFIIHHDYINAVIAIIGLDFAKVVAIVWCVDPEKGLRISGRVKNDTHMFRTKWIN